MSIFLFVCYDINVIYCILKGFSLYDFGNKFDLIVIFICQLFIHENASQCLRNDGHFVQGIWVNRGKQDLCAPFSRYNYLMGYSKWAFIVFDYPLADAKIYLKYISSYTFLAYRVSFGKIE